MPRVFTRLTSGWQRVLSSMSQALSSNPGWSHLGRQAEHEAEQQNNKPLRPQQRRQEDGDFYVSVWGLYVTVLNVAFTLR
jgi:hypothetical protein